VDNLRNPDSALAVRNGFFIYHGWSDSYSARNCYYSGVAKRYSREESRLTCGEKYTKSLERASETQRNR
jgi:hypothetical protein